MIKDSQYMTHKEFVEYEWVEKTKSQATERRKDAIDIIVQYWDEEWISFYKEYYYGMIDDADYACIRDSLWTMPELVCVAIANNIEDIPIALQVALHSLIASRLPKVTKEKKLREVEGITYNLAKEN
jgi:hypothetical protein